VNWTPPSRQKPREFKLYPFSQLQRNSAALLLRGGHPPARC
jgi:hypothetical protein